MPERSPGDGFVVTRTPFRVSFFGGGTDYPAWYREHGGAVLSTTIDKYCYVALRRLAPIFDYRFRVVHSKIEQVRAAAEIEHPMIRAVLERAAPGGGLELHQVGDVQTGTGLGASSAFTVGLLNALDALAGRPVPREVLARQAIGIEQDVVLEAVGSQDQIAAAYGGFNHIVFHADDRFEVAPLALPAERLAALQDRLLLYFTGFARHAAGVARATIDNLPWRQPELRRMAEMVGEALALLHDPDAPLDAFGALLDEHWQLKRRLSPNVSTPEIDGIYAAAMGAGALGGKLLGAGGGGVLLLFAEPGEQARLRERLKHLVELPFRFERTGSRVISVSDAERAGMRVPSG